MPLVFILVGIVYNFNDLKMSMHPERNYFAEFRNGYDWFVETGSYRGDGIQFALDAGFYKIISIDNDPTAIDFCMDRFDLKSNLSPLASRISLFNYDSAERLYYLIKDIKKPILFWLDSHWQMLEGTDPGANPFPLLKELEQIGQHPIKTHTIIIDDMLIMQKNITGYDKIEIIEAIEIINPNYIFKMRSNPVINNILIAHV